MTKLELLNWGTKTVPTPNFRDQKYDLPWHKLLRDNYFQVSAEDCLCLNQVLLKIKLDLSFISFFVLYMTLFVSVCLGMLLSVIIIIFINVISLEWLAISFYTNWKIRACYNLCAYYINMGSLFLIALLTVINISFHSTGTISESYILFFLLPSKYNKSRYFLSCSLYLLSIY